jgi:hypothetical protein
MKKQFNDWLRQGKLKKTIDELHKQHPDNQQVIIISARTYTYLQNNQNGVELSSESRVNFANLIRDLFQLVEHLYSNVATPVPFIEQKVEINPTNELTLKIEGYYQTMTKISCRVKALDLTKRETQDMMKSLSAEISLLCFGTGIPPPYLDKPSMPPNTIICCRICRESDIQLEGNDQCPNCKLSAYAWI